MVWFVIVAGAIVCGGSDLNRGKLLRRRLQQFGWRVGSMGRGWDRPCHNIMLKPMNMARIAPMYSTTR